MLKFICVDCEKEYDMDDLVEYDRGSVCYDCHQKNMARIRRTREA